jgi:hypothetical protein
MTDDRCFYCLEDAQYEGWTTSSDGTAIHVHVCKQHAGKLRVGGFRKLERGGEQE